MFELLENPLFSRFPKVASKTRSMGSVHLITFDIQLGKLLDYTYRPSLGMVA